MGEKDKYCYTNGDMATQEEISEIILSDRDNGTSSVPLGGSLKADVQTSGKQHIAGHTFCQVHEDEMLTTDGKEPSEMNLQQLPAQTKEIYIAVDIKNQPLCKTTCSSDLTGETHSIHSDSKESIFSLTKSRTEEANEAEETQAPRIPAAEPVIKKKKRKFLMKLSRKNVDDVHVVELKTVNGCHIQHAKSQMYMQVEDGCLIMAPIRTSIKTRVYKMLRSIFSGYLLGSVGPKHVYIFTFREDATKKTLYISAVNTEAVGIQDELVIADDPKVLHTDDKRLFYHRRAGGGKMVFQAAAFDNHYLAYSDGEVKLKEVHLAEVDNDSDIHFFLRYHS